jgi:hypothetical protein
MVGLAFGFVTPPEALVRVLFVAMVKRKGLNPATMAMTVPPMVVPSTAR